MNTCDALLLLVQVRFEMCAQALDASIITIAPWRDPSFIEQFKGRTDLLAYASKHNIPVSSTPKVHAASHNNSIHACVAVCDQLPHLQMYICDNSMHLLHT
jgi:argininosuccinate synthase